LLLDFLVLDSMSLVYALTSDTLQSFELRISRTTLAGLVDFTRELIASPDSADSRELWRPPLRRLRQALLGPVETAGLLERKQRLIIIPHAELHYLPFAALLGGEDRESFLVERFEIVYAPSVSVWLRLGDRELGPTSSTVLAVAPRSASLPGTLSEVELIQRHYGSRTSLLTDRAATESIFRRAAPQHGIVHLATYGVLNRRNPLFSYVQLRSDSTHDGRLEAFEAYALGLHPNLLVLSACETGLAAGATTDVPLGDEWLGLVQAFLSAGAGSVLATQWRVNDDATARFMDLFYGQLIGTRSVATALAQAQRVFLSHTESRSPLYWAGFVLNSGTQHLN
jgi:CHAT domain-containing protein